MASPDGTLVLHVDPETQSLVVARGAMILWSIHRTIRFEAFYLSNTGTVAIVAWRCVQIDDLDEPALELWNATGRLRSNSVRDLIAHPPGVRGGGPMGGFWREWLVDAAQLGDTLAIETTCPFAYSVDLDSGDRERSLRPAGVATWLLGLAMLGLAAFAVARTRRTMRATELVTDRRRLRMSVVAPIAVAVLLWLHFAAIPFVPTEVVAMIELGVLVVALVCMPSSLIAAARAPHAPLLRLALVVASLVVMLVVGFTC